MNVHGLAQDNTVCPHVRFAQTSVTSVRCLDRRYVHVLAVALYAMNVPIIWTLAFGFKFSVSEENWNAKLLAASDRAT